MEDHFRQHEKQKKIREKKSTLLYVKSSEKNREKQ